MPQAHEFGEGKTDVLRPDRALEVHGHAEGPPTHVYRSRTGEWLTTKTGEGTMLYWAAMFFVIAIVAAVFGFTGLAAGAAGIAKVLFAVFIVLFIISLSFGTARRPRGR